MDTVSSGSGYDPFANSENLSSRSKPDRTQNSLSRLEYPATPAWDLLERTASQLPDRVATHLFGKQLTYGEANQNAVRLANWLQNNGLEPGDRVGILLPNMPEYLIALNGIWRAGGVAVSLSPMAVSNDIAKLIKLTDCRIVISLDLLTDRFSATQNIRSVLQVSMQRYLPALKKAAYLATKWTQGSSIGIAKIELHDFWETIQQSNGQPEPVPVEPATTPAYVIDTGGTHEDPKAVTLSHQNLVANAWQQYVWAAEGLTFGQETMLGVLPFFHSFGMSTMLLGGVALGATLLLQPRFDANRVLTAIERHRPTVFHAVPALLSALNRRLKNRTADLSSLNWVISGGAPLPDSVAEEFQQISGARVVEGYGLSEASPVTHSGPLDGTNILGTVGLPLPDTECRIVDAATGKDLPAGEIGELLVRGPQVMLGYWNNSQATAQAIRDGWLHTGDLATVDKGGYFRIVGRQKDLIITSGFNVYPTDVEAVLKGCELIADVAVVGVPDDQRGEIVKAFVVLNEGHDWDTKQLDGFSREHLAAHRRPRKWEQVHGEIPKNILGSVDRQQLQSKADS